MTIIFTNICRKFWDKPVKILEKVYEKFDEIFEKLAENSGSISCTIIRKIFAENIIKMREKGGGG